MENDLSPDALVAGFTNMSLHTEITEKIVRNELIKFIAIFAVLFSFLIFTFYRSKVGG